MTKALVIGNDNVDIAATAMAKEEVTFMMEAAARVDGEEARQGLESDNISVGSGNYDDEGAARQRELVRRVVAMRGAVAVTLWSRAGAVVEEVTMLGQRW
ncbi:hypothetical protein BHM03_00001984 [Ensete ventricosum]|nr:hypothetical protein BHM03_00001984 [Ensete ventricosum]